MRRRADVVAKMKNVYVIAGPNGSGKTTFAKKFLPRYVKCSNFVNADLIAQGLSPFSPGAAALKAGKLVLEQISELARAGEDFSFETTLAGRSYADFLKRLKKNGYSAHVFFLWIPDVRISLARIKERVADGGHDVPAADVRRRFGRCLKNFFRLYRPILSTWMIFDNSGARPSPVAVEKNGKLVVRDRKLFDIILAKAGAKI